MRTIIIADWIVARMGHRLFELASQSDPPKSNTMGNKASLDNNQFTTSKLSILSESTTTTISAAKTPRHTKLGRDKTRREMLAELEFVKKNGITRIHVKMKALFAGRRQLIERLKDPLATLDDCLISLDLKNSLMSDKQIEELNPIAILIEKLSDMPNMPISFEVILVIETARNTVYIDI